MLNTKFIIYQIFIFIFIINFARLFFNSNDIVWVEIFKILPIYFFLFIYFLKNSIKQLILRIGFFLFFIHFIVAIIASIFSLNFFTYDNRFILYFLGRGANETGFALAFLFAIIYIKNIRLFLFGNRDIPKFYIYIACAILIFLTILTDSRSSLIFILLVLFLNIKKIHKNVYFLTVLLVLLLASLFNELNFVERSINELTNNVTQGRIILYKNNLDYYNNIGLIKFFFGNDLDVKYIDHGLNYFINDPHSLYFDLINYFGFIFLFFYSFVIIKIIIYRNSIDFSLLYAFLFTSLFVSIFRYPYLFYLGYLIFLITFTRYKKYD